MAESSMFWDGNSYAANTFDDIFGGPWTDGVLKGKLNNLAVSGATSPLSVATGWAIVNGKLYKNTAAVSVAVSTPAADTRIDRVVLRADYVAKTVTIELLGGVEGSGSAPALTQTDGTIWEISLAQVSITTAGAITLTSERVPSKRRGQWMKGMCLRIKATLSGHYPVDPDLGGADADWHLCNGDTENGVATPNSANKLLMSAGGTYTPGSSGGAATKDLSHTHTSGTLAGDSGGSHSHDASDLTVASGGAHTHGPGTLAISAHPVHSHGYGTIAVAAHASHRHAVSITSGNPDWLDINVVQVGATYSVVTSTHKHVVSGDTGWSGEWTHTVSGSTGNNASEQTHSFSGGATASDGAHTHSGSISIVAGGAHSHTVSGTTASGGSATQDIMPPYEAEYEFCYVGGLSG